MTPLNLPLLSRVLTQPWAIRQQSLVALTQALLAGDASRVPHRGMELETRAPSPQAATSWNVGQWTEEGYKRAPLPTSPGYTIFNAEGYFGDMRGNLPALPEGTTCLLIWGVLGRGWTESDRWWLDAIEADEIVATLTAAPENSTVVLWFRSPGGIVTGIPETAAEIRRVKKARNLRLVGFSDDLVASAAYWLAAMCDLLLLTPTAEAGSIGVYLAYYDFCGYLDKAGVKLEMFRAGELKGLGVMGHPLDEKARAYLQAGVLDAYAAFTRDVTNQRKLEDATMQGQTFSGRDARTANLCDAFQPSAAAFFAALGKGRV